MFKMQSDELNKHNLSILSLTSMPHQCVDQQLHNYMGHFAITPLGANPTKWSNTLKQFLANFPTNCLSVFDHFVKLALKGLIKSKKKEIN